MSSEMAEQSEMPEPCNATSLDEVVQHYYAEHGVVVSYILIADVMDVEGDRYVMTAASEGAPPWVVKGLMDHVREGMQAAHTIAAIESRGPEEEGV